MSIYPKFLWGITIDSNNQTFGYNLGGAQTDDITAGSYATILEVLSELDTQLAGTFTVSVSSIGIVTISNSVSWTVDWATTDDNLEAMLGFDGTETVTGSGPYVLTSTSQHQYGYYPGLITFGCSTAKGTGFTTPLRWSSVWDVSSVRAGNRKLRRISSGTQAYESSPTLGMIDETELDHANGLQNFGDECITRQFRLYPDREDGTVSSPGTEDTEYYTCTLNTLSGIDPDPSGQSTKHWTCTIPLNKESAS